MLAFLLQRVQNRLNLRRDVFGHSEVRRPFADLCCPVLSSPGVDLSEQLAVKVSNYSAPHSLISLWLWQRQ